MITTTERQENLIDQYGALINPLKARVMRDAGLGIIESRCEGPYVWDQAGTRYIDCRDEHSVYNVGRHNPKLVKTLIESAREYDLGTSEFFSEPRVQLAHKLGQISPGGELSAAAFGVSADEINHFAIKLARAHTGRTQAITIQQSLLQSSDPNLVQVPFDNIEAVTLEINEQTACVIVEPIQGYNSIHVSQKGYLKRLRKLCDRYGALLIIDETETGLGRTGKMFALEHEAGVIPDIVTIGNALSGGLFPITAAIFREDYLNVMNDQTVAPASSFAGSDLGCVIGLATIEYIEQHRLAKRAHEKGERFAKGFKEIIRKFPLVIREFRHCGLMMAVDFASEDVGPQMSRDLSQFGVLAAYDVQYPDTMRIMPSLTIEDDDVDHVLDSFSRSLAGAHSILSPMDPDLLEDLIRSIRS